MRFSRDCSGEFGKPGMAANFHKSEPLRYLGCSGSRVRHYGSDTAGRSERINHEQPANRIEGASAHSFVFDFARERKVTARQPSPRPVVRYVTAKCEIFSSEQEAGMMGRAIHDVERQRDEVCEPTTSAESAQPPQRLAVRHIRASYQTRLLPDCIALPARGCRSVSVADCWPKF
jgi:hypothetical protein